MKHYDLILNKGEYNDYFLENEQNFLEYLPKSNLINIFIGANNSGKSRFMRKLMNENKIDAFIDYSSFCQNINEYNINVEVFNDIISLKKRMIDEDRTYYVGGTNHNEEKKNKLLRNLLKPLSIEESDSIFKNFNENKIKIENFKNEIEFNDNIKSIDPQFYKMFSDYKKYYIPTLRTSHSLFQKTIEKINNDVTKDVEYEKIEDDIYLHTYIKNYKIDESINVFTGLHLYREILNSRNSKKETRLKFEDFEKFVGVNFFNGTQIDIVAEFNKEKSINNNNEDEIINIYLDGDKETRYLHDLGDGIQAIIILMYKIFMAEPNSFIYIDEPEINLHPGMQRLFLEQISTNKTLIDKNIRYFITTHSNHFLDLSIEKDNVSIYTFSPLNTDGEHKFVVKNVNSGDNTILKELGVNNSSVFLANSSIWVEGISDRYYIKAFLKSYLTHIKETLREDIDFAFFEYAGSNIDHYFFGDNEVDNENKELLIKDIKSFSLNNRIFLVADSDMSKKNSKKGVRLNELEKLNNDNFNAKIIWNIREIENLLTDEIWQEILIDLCDKTLVDKDKEAIKSKIDKATSKIKSSKFSMEYIGNYLNAVRVDLGMIDNKHILNKSNYKESDEGKYGTLINKRFVSELVFEKDFPWDVFSKSKEIKNLTEEIYKFIKN